MLDVEIARETRFCVVSCGQVGFGVTIQYTENDKSCSNQRQSRENEITSQGFCFNLIPLEHVHGVSLSNTPAAMCFQCASGVSSSEFAWCWHVI